MTFQHLVPEGIETLKEINTAIIDAAKKCDKPTAIVLYNAPELADVAQEEREKYIKAGLPLFSSIASAARAIGKLIQYQDYRDSLAKAHS